VEIGWDEADDVNGARAILASVRYCSGGGRRGDAGGSLGAGLRPSLPALALEEAKVPPFGWRLKDSAERWRFRETKRMM